MCALLVFSLVGARAQKAVLCGHVKLKGTEVALAGANVYISGTTIGGATNNKGDYCLPKLQVGSYDIIVSFSGYKHVKQTVSLNEGENVLDVELEPSSLDLGEIVITGTGTAHHLKTAPVPTELIGKKLVSTIAATDFSELMTSVTPSFDFSPSAMGSFMTLNGLGNDYILVLVDGKRMYGDVGGQNDINRINPDDIERIEVLKGASSLLYGSDAIAGVVNIITKKSKRRFDFSNTSRIKKYHTWQQNNSLDLNLGKFSLNSSLSMKQSDGWQLSAFEQDKDGNLDSTDAMAVNAYEDFTWRNTLRFRPTKKMELYVSNTLYNKDVYRPESYKKYGYYYEDRAYSAGAKYKLNKKDYITLDYDYDNYLYYYRYNQDYSSYKEGELVEQNDQRMNNLRLKYVDKISKKNTLTLGADYLLEQMFSEGRLVDGEASASTISIYAQDEMTILEDLDIVAGVRAVKHNEFGSAFTPKLSLLYKLNDFNFRASYGWGFKAPTIKELYYAYEKSGTLYMGNTDLDPQKSQFSSLGVEYHHSVFTAGISAYINNIDGMIDYQTVDSIAGDAANGIEKRRQHYNIEEARSAGIDFIFEAQIGYGFSLGAAYSYVDAMNLSSDVPLENVAQHYANVHLAYDQQFNNYHLNVNLSGRYQDEKFYEGEPNAKAYQLWKLTTNHRISNIGGVILEGAVGIDNIFDYVDDTPYGSYTHTGTLNPGRSLFASIKFNFSL